MGHHPQIASADTLLVFMASERTLGRWTAVRDWKRFTRGEAHSFKVQGGHADMARPDAMQLIGPEVARRLGAG